MRISYNIIERVAFATDASAYSEMPEAVAWPENEEDIIELVEYARKNKKALIPRAAGTSIAGQVVGSGIVMEIGKRFSKILEINKEERWVRVQPGIVRDELNIALRPYGLMFSPETSTSDRCMIGGMVGNNSCGSHSLVYGSVRDHLMEARVVLADGKVTTFKRLGREEVEQKKLTEGLEGEIYRIIDRETENLDIEAFPDSRLRRRNNGYALDLVRTEDDGLDLCKILCGSEGTLAIATELKLGLDPLPPKESAVLCCHFDRMESVFEANLMAIETGATAVELIDGKIIQLSRKTLAARENAKLIEGNPEAVLAIEFAEHSEEALNRKIDAIRSKITDSAYAYRVLRGKEAGRIWSLRKAGLGILGNIEGDAKPVSLVEDTAVVPERLGEYIREFRELMQEYALECVYYAHIGTGELHLRPVIDIRSKKGKKQFREIAERVALLVKKHRGSLSGEHGDGRLRGEFIPLMYGQQIYEKFCLVKDTFDPDGILNPGKIVRTPPMDKSLRYKEIADGERKTYFTYQHGQDVRHLVRAIEQCNGTAQCKKSRTVGGAMCPVFKREEEETASTRARANLLREAVLRGDFKDKTTIELLEQCLSCKACKSECPSSVDMTKLKAEYLQQHYDETRTPLQAFLTALQPLLYRIGSRVPRAFNQLTESKITYILTGFSKERKMPKIAEESFRRWYNNQERFCGEKRVFLLVDEFTDNQAPETAKAFVRIANRLGFSVEILDIKDTGRTSFSAGMVRRAKKLAVKNIEKVSRQLEDNDIIVGLEPSALLTLKDEYESIGEANRLSNRVLMYDEWLTEVTVGTEFEGKEKRVYYHPHCHQTALSDSKQTKQLIERSGAVCELLPDGCCGMAGAYGYKHYEESVKTAEPLTSAILALPEDAVILATGISCRTQIHDLTGRKAEHPIIFLSEIYG